jgi:hypothetical protein
VRFHGSGCRRYATLVWVAALFLLINGALRLGLTAFEAEPANFLLASRRHCARGRALRLGGRAFLLSPFALLAAPARTRLPAARCTRWRQRARDCGPVCDAVHGRAELLFWNEFATRFNFIAVDYLVYTREVLGNIRQSYPVAPLLAGVAAAVLALFAAIRKPVWRAAGADGGRLPARLLAMLGVFLLPWALFLAIGDAPREALPSVSARALAGNGTYEFARAFRANELDYHGFYRTIAEPDAVREMRNEFAEARPPPSSPTRIPSSAR